MRESHTSVAKLHIINNKRLKIPEKNRQQTATFIHSLSRATILPLRRPRKGVRDRTL